MVCTGTVRGLENNMTLPKNDASFQILMSNHLLFFNNKINRYCITKEREQSIYKKHKENNYLILTLHSNIMDLLGVPVLFSFDTGFRK